MNIFYYFQWFKEKEMRRSPSMTWKSKVEDKSKKKKKEENKKDVNTNNQSYM